MTIDCAPLPASELVFGLSEHGHHIVTREDAETALQLTGADLRWVTVPAVCRRMVGVATAWGPYRREEALKHPHRCPDCAWILALHNGGVEDEIAAFTAHDVVDTAVIADRMGDLGAQLLTAIARDPELTHGGQRLRPSQQSQLLGHAIRHLPVVGMCEECLDIGVVNAHGEGQSCPAQEVICAGCTLTAHEAWAGEWYETFLPECIVTAPCSVLAAMAAHYQIPTRTPTT